MLWGLLGDPPRRTSYLLFTSNVWQRPVERNRVASQKIELVNLKQLLFLEQIFRLYHDGVSILSCMRLRIEIVLIYHVPRGVRDFILGMTDIVPHDNVDAPTVNVFLLVVPAIKITRVTIE